MKVGLKEKLLSAGLAVATTVAVVTTGVTLYENSLPDNPGTGIIEVAADETEQDTEETTAGAEQPTTETGTIGADDDAGTEEPGADTSDATADATPSDDATDNSGTAMIDDTGETVVKYFPVTLFDYDQNTINNETHQLEVDANPNLTLWNGLYFGKGGATESYTYVNSNTIVEAFERFTPTFDDSGNLVLDDGEYIIVNKRSGLGLVGGDNAITGVAAGGTSMNADAVAAAGITVWTITKTTDGYTLVSDGKYMTLGSGTETTYMTDSATVLELVEASGDGECFMIKNGSQYLNHYGGGASTTFGGYGSSTDVGSFFYIHKKAETYSTTSTAALDFAEYNDWIQNDIYSGLAQNTLDANGDIHFNVPVTDILYSKNTTNKAVYTDVGLPFEYNTATKQYVFDSAEFGAYGSVEDNAGNVLSGEGVRSNYNLYYDETPQSNGTAYGDGSNKLWQPYNNTASIGSESNCNYYFGMMATIPFTMTSNGRQIAADDTSEPIQFSFSGDDDVWVYIDGQLVVDLGGIHNRQDVVIDFAANTITYSVSNTSSDEMTDRAENYSFANSTLTLQLFDDANGEGLLSQTRETFASYQSHDLTIFYLERGAGSANCKIAFNFPMDDTVSVIKKIDEAYDSDAGTYRELTERELEKINSMEFSFTIYKDGVPLANTNYNLLNIDNQVVATHQTDANGHFTLKNLETAKFFEEFETDGADYQVVEDTQDGFVYTTWTYSGEVFGQFIVDGTSYGTKAVAIPTTTNNQTSAEINASGNDDETDSLMFICENYVDANLPDPSIKPNNDRIVIDYGLPVEIDVLRNDLFEGDKLEINEVTGAKYGTAEITADGKIKYTLTQAMSDVEVLTYTARATGSSTNVGGTMTVLTETATATVYIIPATEMYYEEDFGGLITFNTTATWTPTGTADGELQEPGIVGTVADSPYGSDAAYLNDSGDSNGTSMYVSTSGQYPQFAYTFKGTGTAFYARTSTTSPYMRISLYKIDELNDTRELIQTNFRDSMIIPNDNISQLYNIPVYSIKGLEYGTYTVSVTLYKAGTPTGVEGGAGADFYFDGVTIYEPLDEAGTAELVQIANAAYDADAEENCVIAEVRDKLLADNTITGTDGLIWVDEDSAFVTLTDTDAAIDSAADFEAIAPKNEVYLHNGQSITFSLANWDANAGKIYLGMKTPKATQEIVTVGTTKLTIANSTDCYYDISSMGVISEVTDADGNTVKVVTFTITSGADSLVSITNLKVTGIADFVILP